MRSTEKKSRTLYAIAISLLCAILFVSSCRIPDPTLLPYIDVLRPGPNVDILGFDSDGNPVVTPEYIIWVEDLKTEIRRLRGLLNE